jgi:hypothetical protein
MTRRGRRRRIDTGIFSDDSGISIIAYGKEVRMPLESSHGELLRRRAALIDELVEDDPSIGAAAGTLRRDIPRYLELAKHLADPKNSRRAHLNAWLPYIGDKVRRHISKHDILKIRGQWIEWGIAPITCTNR